MLCKLTRLGSRVLLVGSIAATVTSSCTLNTKGEGASYGGTAADAGGADASSGAGGAAGSTGGSGGWLFGGTAGSVDVSVDGGAGGQGGSAAGQGGSAGGLGGSAGADAADDSPADVVGEEPACAPGLTDCSGVCANLQSDVGHCGSCGQACSGANASCVNSNCECVPDCVSANGCGSDGCNGSCGDCELGWSCYEGYCVKEWATTGAWSCHEKCGGNTAAEPSLTCVGSESGGCDEHETLCYCWCAEEGTCSL